MSLRKQVRSKVYMDEVFALLGLGERSRYGRIEFDDLEEAIGEDVIIGSVESKLVIEDVVINGLPQQGGGGGPELGGGDPEPQPGPGIPVPYMEFASIENMCVYINGTPDPALNGTVYWNESFGQLYTDSNLQNIYNYTGIVLLYAEGIGYIVPTNGGNPGAVAGATEGIEMAANLCV